MNRITRLVAIVVAVAALGVATVKAQTGDGSVRFVSYASVGLIPGEKVRVSVVNTASAGNIQLSFQYYLAHGTNSSISVPFHETGWMTVPPGEFRFSGVSRDDLQTAGEPGTGRARMMVKVRMITQPGSNSEDFPGSLEIIAGDGMGGDSVQADSKYRLIYLPARRGSVNAPVGFLPGHRLSYSFFNPNEEGSQPVRVQAYIYDSYGNLLKQTDPVVVRPGQFHTLAFNRDDLGVAGEDGTGRIPVRTGIQVVLMDGSVRTVNLPVSFELVNNATGRTVAGGGPYSTGYVKVSPDDE